VFYNDRGQGVIWGVPGPPLKLIGPTKERAGAAIREKTYTIYMITNLNNQKAYIGQTTKPIKTRWRGHCHPKSTCKLLSRAIKKYGEDGFKITPIFQAENIDELNMAETQAIIFYNTLAPNGYNLTTGGNNRLLSEDAKQKRRDKFNNMPQEEKDRRALAVKERARIKRIPKIIAAASDLYGEAIAKMLKNAMRRGPDAQDGFLIKYKRTTLHWQSILSRINKQVKQRQKIEYEHRLYLRYQESVLQIYSREIDYSVYDVGLPLPPNI